MIWIRDFLGCILCIFT